MSHRSPMTTETKQTTHADYTIGWVCALFQELAAARAMLDVRHPDLTTPPADENCYALGSIGEHNIVIAALPVGMYGTNSAANVATQMVNTFPNIKFGFMIGIGGGVPPKVRLGDVVVGIPGDGYPGVVQWDMGKATEGGTFQRTGALNNPPRLVLAALARLRADHEESESKIPQYLAELKEKYPKMAPKYLKNSLPKDVAFKSSAPHVSRSNKPLHDYTSMDDHGKEEIVEDEDDDEEEEDDDAEEDVEKDGCQWCDRTKTFKDNTRGMRVHYGLIASGNQVIKDAMFRDKLNKTLDKKVLCVEMEAAGLVNIFPCLVIRGICDYADAHKNKAWQPHAAAVAAAFAKELLGYIQRSDIESSQPVKDVLEKLEASTSRLEKGIQILHSNWDEDEARRIVTWLITPDYGLIHADLLSKKQAGTGEQFLTSKEFQDWYRGNTQTLFCSGRPGAGKTIITATVIDWLQKEISHTNNTSVGIAYIYFNYKRYNDEKTGSLFANLLGQLSRKLPSVPDAVKKLYQRHKKGESPDIQEYLDALLHVAAKFTKVYFLIDAVDECHPEHQRSLLTEIYNFQAKSRSYVSVFATSREIPEIKKHFDGKPTVDISGSKNDLQKYMEGRLPYLPEVLSRKKELWEEIKCRTITAADGIFLLVKLRLEYLQSLVTENQILGVLEKAQHPNADHIYRDAYDQIMTRIQGQHGIFFGYAKSLLSWITGARRQLTNLELSHALAIQVGSSEFDEKDIPDLKKIVSFCCGLVTFDKESGIVRLVHFTAQEYLVENQMIWLEDMETEIAKKCVTYISYKVFEEGECQFFTALSARLQSYPLYDYAAKNWGYHAKAAVIGDGPLVIDFLNSEEKVSASSEVLLGIQPFKDYIIPSYWTWMHISAFFGLESSIRAMLIGEIDIDEKDLYDRTPLSWAAENGHQAVARLLIEVGADIEAKSSTDQTPLIYATKNGHEAVVRTLIKTGANIESRNFDDQTPLFCAARYGYEAVVRLLIEAGADIETQYEYQYNVTPRRP